MADAPSVDYVYRAVCRRVVDGDTVDLKVDLGHNVYVYERYRIARINAPGIRKPEAKTLEEKKKGIDATVFLTDLLCTMYQGKRMPLCIQTLKDKKGKFGRYLAEIWVGDLNINDHMVVSGHAEYKEY